MAEFVPVEPLDFIILGGSGGRRPACGAGLCQRFPRRDVLPTRGIEANDVAAYLDIDAVACVGASWLADPAQAARGMFSEITARAARLVAKA